MSETTAPKLAKYILYAANQRGIQMTNLKLQKLLYYCQAWHLAITESELFPERIEAWVHGPVVPPVFRMFKEYRWNNLPLPSEEPEIEYGEPSCPIRDHVAEVLDAYAHLSGYQLEALTHHESPWLSARNGIAPDAPSTARITNESMKEYYQSRLI